MDQLIVEVDVSPVEAQQFPLAESAEDRHGKESSVAGCRRFEEASDLLRVEDGPFLPREAWPFAAVELADRVDFDQNPATACPNSRDNGVKIATTVAPE